MSDVAEHEELSEPLTWDLSLNTDTDMDIRNTKRIQLQIADIHQVPIRSDMLRSA